MELYGGGYAAQKGDLGIGETLELTFDPRPFLATEMGNYGDEGDDVEDAGNNWRLESVLLIQPLLIG